MFSVMSFSSQGRFHVTINHDTFDLTIPGPPWTWGSLYRAPTPKAPALHLVATEPHTVGKRAVHILLECFLVCLCELKRNDICRCQCPWENVLILFSCLYFQTKVLFIINQMISLKHCKDLF